MMEFDKFFLSLHLRCLPRGRNRRHIEDERQTLGYLILEIWTIFNSTQITGNDAHAEVYISVSKTALYAQSVSLLLVTRRKAVQSPGIVAGE